MKTKLYQKLIATNPASWVPLPLRLGLGLVMMAHGAQKLFGWFGGYGLEGTAGFFSHTLGMEPGLLWAILAGSGEFFGGLLVFLGLLTRPGAALVAITMAVAVLTVHFPAFFAANNGVEFPLSLLLAAVALLLSGGGRLSVDSRLQA
jgi:putative oxidoreductase